MSIPRKTVDYRKLYPWEGAFQNWSRAWVRKHHWRVATLIGSEEDALQECAVVFTRCLNNYAQKIDNPAWLMGLYKVAIVNQWNTFAEADRRLRMSRDPEYLAPMIEASPRVDVNCGPLAASLHSASAELRQVLTMIASAPTDLLDLIFAPRTPELVNRQLRRMCRISRDVDLLSELREVVS
jgi:hypothetical protein